MLRGQAERASWLSRAVCSVTHLLAVQPADGLDPLQQHRNPRVGKPYFRSAFRVRVADSDPPGPGHDVVGLGPKCPGADHLRQLHVEGQLPQETKRLFPLSVYQIFRVDGHELIAGVAHLWRDVKKQRPLVWCYGACCQH